MALFLDTVTGLIDTWQRSSVENQYYFLAMLRLWLCFDVLVLAVRCVHHDVALLLSLACSLVAAACCCNSLRRVTPKMRTLERQTVHLYSLVDWELLSVRDSTGEGVYLRSIANDKLLDMGVRTTEREQKFTPIVRRPLQETTS